MIFNTEVDNFYEVESYKERNLYYKVLAGYVLNEFITGYQQRKAQLFELLQNNCDKENFVFGDAHIGRHRLVKLANEDIHVKFDFHPRQIYKDDFDHGEMSDVLMSGSTTFCSIECKYYDNYTFKKDITQVQTRIIEYSRLTGLAPLQVLLIPEQKFRYSTQSSLIGQLDTPVIFLLWEQLAGIIEEEQVKIYLDKQLKRKF